MTNTTETQPRVGDLDGWAERLTDVVTRSLSLSTNEMEMRLHVEPVVRDALRALYGIDLHQIRSERTNSAGRLDTAYGGVVVEFEWSMSPARRRHGAQQALDYLAAERSRIGLENMFSAVVTDGKQWGFLIADELATPEINLFLPVPEDPAEHFVWQPHSVAASRRFLEIVGSNPKGPVSGAALVAALGRGSMPARLLVSLFVEAVRNREAGDRADIFYKEWRRALEVAYGILDADVTDVLVAVREAYNLATTGSLGEFLFALHSYFALVARLVAIEILAISVGDKLARPSNWIGLADDLLIDRLRSLERGLIPQGLRITNLLEGDVFSWYLDRLEGNVTLLNAVREACRTLERFAFPRIAFGAVPAIDLFRDLYQGLTTRELRKALGEFLTPPWLAQATLEAAGRNGAKLLRDRVLDCTCGTGTFLAPLIAARLQLLRRRRKAPTAPEVQEVLNSVVGIDINPVAVVAARLNYLIAMGDLATLGDFYLPVWMADSVLLPEEPEVQNDWVKHPTLTGRTWVELETSLETPFILPPEILTQTALARLADLLRDAVGRGDSPEDFRRLLVASLGPDASDPAIKRKSAWRNAVEVLEVLYTQMMKLQERGVDGVWAEIIENRFAPLFLAPFDLVVGNPPWLTFTRLPEAWRRKAEPIWRNYGMFEAPRMPGVAEPRSLQTSDIAVLVTAVAMDRYLRPGGLLAFVVPKALINGDPGNRAFRQWHLRSSRDALARRKVDLKYSAVEIMDFSEVRPFSPDAANSPVVLVLETGRKARFPIKGSRWSRQAASASIREISWDRVSRIDLRSEPVRWLPISTYESSPLAWWRSGEKPVRGQPCPYTFGKGFDTRGANGILMVEVKASAGADGKVRIANLPEMGRDPDVKRMGPRTANVEAELVVPLVRGRDVGPYAISSGNVYLVLPHDPSKREEVLTEKEILRYPGALQFLQTFRSQLLERSPYMSFRPTENQWWQVQGVEHMNDGYLVCVPEIASRPQAAVLHSRWDERLGRSVLPVPDHKIVFYQTSSESEAYYLAALINSSALQRLLTRYANFTAVSPLTLRYLPIPRFEKESALHKAVARLSKEAHQNAGEKRAKTLAALQAKVEDCWPPSEDAPSEDAPSEGK